MRIIREAQESELSRVLDLLKELDQEAELGTEEARSILKRMKQYPFYKLYVAVDKDVILGTFCLLVCDNLGHGGTPFAIIDNVVVNPLYQGQGVGRFIMEEAKQIAGEGGCYKLALSSNGQRVHAHQFYEHLGFQQHGVSYLVEVGK